MATVTRKSSPAPNPPAPKAAQEPWVLRACDAIYRFLASLKLAVLSISCLALTLAGATFFERSYGASAAQEYIYRSRGFALLLGFLATNILCAALIRFPWKKRQIGFVVTHAGLLVVLAGTFYSFQKSDEGMVAIVEGAKSSAIQRRDHTAIRVEKLDSQTGEPTDGFVYPFHGGPWAWSSWKTGLWKWFLWSEDERITGPNEPVQLVIRDYLPASSPPMPVYEPDPSGEGIPMIRAALLAKPPGATETQDILGGRDGRGGWIALEDTRFGRTSRDAGPASVVFQYVSGPHAAEMVDDFLHPPKDPLKQSLVRFHYEDKTGKTRVYEWVVGENDTKPFALPDSDLTVRRQPVDERLAQLVEHKITVIQFGVRKGDGPEVTHYGWASLPMMPTFLPGHAKAERAEELVRIGYFEPPAISQATMQGRFGQLEIMGTPDHMLYYRAFARDGLRGIGPLKLGETLPAFGGGKMPMTVSFRVDEYVTSGRVREQCEPIELPVGQLENAIPAAEVTMTVDGHAEKFWLRGSRTYDADFKTVRLPDGVYRVAFDCERKPLGFELTLTDFDVGMDPGTTQPSHFTSEVLLNDPDQGLKDEPKTITMNEPLTHRGWTLYQQSYVPQTDEEGRPTGQFMSVFQVHYDPAWKIIYLGCLTVVLGTFLQFYMRAGIFTDGGKLERARAEAKARKAAAKAGRPVPQATPDPAPAPADETPEFEPL